jgi:hypothetical protein
VGTFFKLPCCSNSRKSLEDIDRAKVIAEVRVDVVSESQKERKQADKYRGYDPIRTFWTQSGSFHTAWFKNGESLSILQRAGYTVFSLLFISIGLYLSRFAVMFAREGDFMTLIFGGCSVGFLVFGVLGLRNVLRFRRHEPRK